MPDLLRWCLAGLTSVGVAIGVFLLATVGIVVAFVVFVVLFVFILLTMRRMKRETVDINGTHITVYSTSSRTEGTDTTTSGSKDQPEVYDLPPTDYMITHDQDDTDRQADAENTSQKPPRG